jgi:hypothetical protein
MIELNVTTPELIRIKNMAAHKDRVEISSRMLTLLIDHALEVREEQRAERAASPTEGPKS